MPNWPRDDMIAAIFALAGTLIGVLGTLAIELVRTRADNIRGRREALRLTCTDFISAVARVRNLSIELKNHPGDADRIDALRNANREAREHFERLRLIAVSPRVQEAGRYVTSAVHREPGPCIARSVHNQPADSRSFPGRRTAHAHRRTPLPGASGPHRWPPEPGSGHRCSRQLNPPPDVRLDIHAATGRVWSANFGVLAAVQLHDVGGVAALWLCDADVRAAAAAAASAPRRPGRHTLRRRRPRWRVEEGCPGRGVLRTAW